MDDNNSNIKVLLIEDNPGDARLIQEMLNEVDASSFELTWVKTLAEAMDYIMNNDIELILSDLSLPDSGGLETFKKLYAKVPNLPIVVLSGMDNELVAINAVHEGAQDYLVKGQVDGNFLMRAMHYAIERKHTEEELRLSKAFTESIINNVPEVIYSLDSEMKITYISPKCEKIYGYTAEEFKNDPTKLWLGVIHPEDKATLEPVYDKLTNGKPYSIEYRIIDKTGQVHWVNDSGNPTIDSEGKIVRLEGSISDITERKHLEEELKKHTECLEEEVQQRTNELIQSEKMAALGQMVAGVAHEVNNPLGYLNANTEIIDEQIKSLIDSCNQKDNYQILNSIDELIQTNMKGINRIAEITKSLKRFAMPDKGELTPADINQGIKDTLLILYNQLKHRIELHEDYGEIPEVVCNIGQLNQVFMNLIHNSSQAMDKGEIWIRTWNDDQNVFVEIKDNGKGIPEKIMNKIFDPFFTTKHDGTGLGLSLCYRIIKDHNGEIKVDSKEGEGTKMLICIPIERRDENGR